MSITKSSSHEQWISVLTTLWETQIDDLGEYNHHFFRLPKSTSGLPWLELTTPVGQVL